MGRYGRDPHRTETQQSLLSASRAWLTSSCPRLSAPILGLTEDDLLPTFNDGTYFQSQKSDPFQGELDEDKAVIRKKHFFNILGNLSCQQTRTLHSHRVALLVLGDTGQRGRTASGPSTAGA